ncbi:MAG: glycosyltransferase, partial [Patescibacteria group bacterium]|nr:glycosyltransferase [Patescibacteria group bacterium]
MKKTHDDSNLWDSTTVSVIIPCWNQCEVTVQCIQALRSATHCDNLDIILIDNGSTDGSRSTFSLDTALNYLYIPTNLGFAGAVNKGLHRARGKYVVVMHNDTIVSGNWLEPLISALEENDDIAAVGPMTNWTTGPQWDQSARYEGLDGFTEYYHSRQTTGDIKRVPSIKSFCMVFPLDLVHAIGGFDEQFFPARFEDEDFCKRISTLGKKCAVVPYSFVHHFGLSTLKSFPKSATAILEENKKRFGQKWGVPPEMSEPQVPFIIKNSGASKQEVVSRTLPDALQELLREGNRLAEKGDMTGAERIYGRVLEQNPHSLEALHNLSILEIKKADFESASFLTAQIHHLEPHFAPAYLIDGVIAQSRGDSGMALQNFKQAIFYDINFSQAYNAYQQTAESLGKKVSNRDADIVFYTAGLSFDGETIFKRGLGGSESAMFYMARSLAQSGLSVKVFNNCERPGMYENVEYGDLTDFYIFNHFNRAKVFVSSRSFKPFQQVIHADKWVVWLHDTVDVAYLKGIDFSKIDWNRLTPFALSHWQAHLWADFLKIPESKFYVTRNGFDPARFSM